ncbi:uncharacterized protein LOC131316813 isoform X1 [Rhododendron vialii]|uniref:uncharacterized protein LOC131316813 isoform X1 n=1 Tax=Rhododendron vialii TaxID=182163 RepID=UPI00265F31DD|nr:uncharacterized protein LOC131316813 isoform X1 [Rhododendron vialii]
MSSLGTSKGVLEIAKFAVYVTVPIGMMYFFANNTDNLKKFMGNGREANIQQAHGLTLANKLSYNNRLQILELGEISDQNALKIPKEYHSLSLNIILFDHPSRATRSSNTTFSFKVTLFRSNGLG